MAERAVALEFWTHSDWSAADRAEVVSTLATEGIEVQEPDGGRGGGPIVNPELVVYVLGGAGSLVGIVVGLVNLYDRFIGRKDRATMLIQVEHRYYVFEQELGDEARQAGEAIPDDLESDRDTGGRRYWRDGAWTDGRRDGA